MTEPAGCGWRAAVSRFVRTALVVAAGAVSGCGGGGDAATSPPAGSAGVSQNKVVYAHSQVLGLPLSQSLTYVPATPPAQPAVQTLTGGSLLNAGSVPLTAEYAPPALAGVRVACISGNGTSIGVLDAINPGVISVSAAVLLGAEWVESDPNSAWVAAAASSEHWDGWENCGVKPEGAPFKSSTVTPRAEGGYVEDVVVGNPGTNFTTVRLAISSSDAAEMSQSGHLTTEDPLRLLRITWRVFADGAGHTVWVERGEPAFGAASGTRGFITLFVPDRQR